MTPDEQAQALALRQSSCGHAFIANGRDPICVHCGISESASNEMAVSGIFAKLHGKTHPQTGK